MATPLGHLLAGAALGVAFGGCGRRRTSAVVGAVAAAAPDLDFVPGLILGDPSRFHHAQSHSLLFVLVAAGLTVLLFRQGRWGLGTLVGLAYASHLMLDLVTMDTSDPRGIPLLWPIWPGVFQSPIVLLPNVQHSSGPVLSIHNLKLALLETLLLGPLLVGALLLARRRGRGGT